MRVKVNVCDEKACASSYSDDDNLRIFLNSSHSFFLHGLFNSSKYDGFFFSYNNQLFKAFDLMFDFAPSSVERRFNTFKLASSNNRLSFLLDKKFMVVRSNLPIKFSFDFDIRKVNNFSIDNRLYSVEFRSLNGVKVSVVSFDKTKYGEPFFFAVAYEGSVSKASSPWIERFYSFDNLRHSESSRFVFSPFVLSSNNFCVAFSSDKTSAVTDAVLNFKRLKLKDIAPFDGKLPTAQDKISVAESYAFSSLKSLSFDNFLIAGFPWFAEEWFRDELTALGYFISSESRLDFVKSILFSVLSYFYNNGLSTNRRFKLLSSDSFGLLALRFQELLNKGFLSQENIEFIKGKFLPILDSIISSKFDTSVNLFVSGPHETWMDSLSREGYCVEIQALMADALSFAFRISKDKKYEDYLNLLLSSVRMRLFKGVLLDRLALDYSPDLTVRPNIFLAYYYCPELLSKELWEKTFDNALNFLWLPWGGLSTVQKDLAVRFDSGEDSKSYHNGNSWFFINNIAALSMAKVNRDKYDSYINKIVDASVDDLLFSGAVGSSSENSSNAVRTSSGCPVQLWSNSTLLELIHNLSR